MACLEVAFCQDEDAPNLALSLEQLEALGCLVLDDQGVARPCSVSVSVVGEQRMAELNGQWRGQERPTDVLSLECERPDDPDLAPGEPCELGDIVLAPSFIEAQAARLGTTPQDETTLLAIHGFLHLLGYDHLQEDEALAMEALEDRLCAEATAGRLSRTVLTRHREPGEKDGRP